VKNDLREFELADWRRSVNDIYAAVRKADDARTGWQHWHAARSALFKSHPMSPVAAADRPAFHEIEVFPYDPALRFNVSLDPVEKATTTLDLGADGKMIVTSFSRTSGLGRRLGAELTVFWIGGYGGGMFVPFRDSTNGDTTYGGGRYIIDAIKGADLGRGPDRGLILDFNFSCNPSCAINNAYVCPLSPPENTFPGAVVGGEKVPLNTF